MRHEVVLLAVLAAGCRVGTLSQEELDRQYPVVRLTTLTGEGLDDSLEELRESVGGKVRITSMNFTDQRTSLTAQNPRSPSEFDNYTYWQGDVHKSAITMRGDDEERYKRELFDLESVPLDQLGTLTLKAVKALPLDGAHVSTVGIDADDGLLVIRVSLESERRRGTVRLDTKGTILEARQD